MSIGRATLVQRSTADEYRGRVIGALLATAALSTLVGTTAGGLLGDRVGIVTMPNVDASSTAWRASWCSSHSVRRR
ncbi:MAG: hypothetical protein M3O34_04340 [Chloroflexota bacterium]|nr:hypothetical protein [Chloroflexota bacterium]